VAPSATLFYKVKTRIAVSVHVGHYSEFICFWFSQLLIFRKIDFECLGYFNTITVLRTTDEVSGADTVINYYFINILFFLINIFIALLSGVSIFDPQLQNLTLHLYFSSKYSVVFIFLNYFPC